MIRYVFNNFIPLTTSIQFFSFFLIFSYLFIFFLGGGGGGKGGGGEEFFVTIVTHVVLIPTYTNKQGGDRR